MRAGRGWRRRCQLLCHREIQGSFIVRETGQQTMPAPLLLSQCQLCTLGLLINLPSHSESQPQEVPPPQLKWAPTVRTGASATVKCTQLTWGCGPSSSGLDSNQFPGDGDGWLTTLSSNVLDNFTPEESQNRWLLLESLLLALSIALFMPFYFSTFLLSSLSFCVKCLLAVPQ